MSTTKRNYGVMAAIIAGIVVVFGAFLWWARSVTTTVDYSNYDANSYIAADENNGYIGDHVKGGDLETAKVVIYEYADFQCPYCATLNPYISEILEDYAGEVVIIFRSYNMSYHENSRAASAAAEVAALQGYYELYSDYLFANQSDWEYASVSSRTDLFVDYFNTVTNGQGDLDQFRTDMASSEVSQKITFDNGIANAFEVPGTPSFYLDGERIDYSSTETTAEAVEYIRSVIDAKLAEVNGESTEDSEESDES